MKLVWTDGGLHVLSIGQQDACASIASRHPSVMKEEERAASTILGIGDAPPAQDGKAWPLCCSIQMQDLAMGTSKRRKNVRGLAMHSGGC